MAAVPKVAVLELEMMEQPLIPAVVVGIPVDDADSAQKVKRVVCAAASLFALAVVQVRDEERLCDPSPLRRCATRCPQPPV